MPTHFLEAHSSQPSCFVIVVDQKLEKMSRHVLMMGRSSIKLIWNSRFWQIYQQGDFYWGFYWVIDWRLRGNNYKKYIYIQYFLAKKMWCWWPNIRSVGGVLRCQKNVSIYDHLIWVFLHLADAALPLLIISHPQKWQIFATHTWFFFSGTC